MPIPFVEKREQRAECGIGNINGRAVFAFQFVLGKQAAIEVRHFAEFAFDGGAVGVGAFFGKAAKEQRIEKTLIKACAGSGGKVCFEPVAQIALVAIQKKLFLQEPQEHQSVDDDRCVPALVVVRRDAVDEFLERIALRLKNLVKLLGDVVAVEAAAQAFRYTEYGEAFFFIQIEADGLELLLQQLGGLPGLPFDFTVLGRAACGAGNPLPYLPGLRGIGKDDEMLARIRRDLALDFLADGVRWNCTLAVRQTVQYLDTAFLCNRLQLKDLPAHLFFDAHRKAIPAELVEKIDELEGLQLLGDLTHVVFRSASLMWEEVDQSSRLRPGTWAKARSALTSVQSSAIAWLTISKSMGASGLPIASSSLRNKL